MRRTRRGSAARPAARLLRPVIPSVLSVGPADVHTRSCGALTPPPTAMAALIANVAKANQRLEDLTAEIETEQESVNKALVDVETARDNAAAAEHDLRGQPAGASRTPTRRSPPPSSGSTPSRRPPI